MTLLLTDRGRRVVEQVTHPLVLRRQLPAPFADARLFVSTEGGLRYFRPRMADVDPNLLRLVSETVRPGDVVWDVGANVGLFSFAAAVAAGHSGEVFALEPDTWLVGLLRRSARANRTVGAPVRVVPVAAAASGGVGQFHIAGRSRSTNYLDGYGSSQTGPVRETQLVPTVTLDSLLDHFTPPDVVKIDVEYAEHLVLDGARRLLSAARPVVVCEVCEPAREAVTAILLDSGYQLFDGDRPAHQRSPLDTAPFTTLAVPAEAQPGRIRPASDSDARHDVDRYFATVAESWADRYKTRPSFVQRLRVVAELAEPVLAGNPAATVLDFGGGPGVFSALCSGRAGRVVTLDRSTDMVLAGARNWAAVADAVASLAPVDSGRVSRVAGTLDALSPAAEGRFDLVLAIAVLEYLNDPAAAVAKLGRLLAPGGTMIVTIPRERSVLRRTERFAATAVTHLGVTSGNRRLADRSYTGFRPHGDRVPWYPTDGLRDLRVEQVRPLAVGAVGMRSLVRPNEVVVIRRDASRVQPPA